MRLRNGKPLHHVEQIDADAKTAVCVVCGPVRVYRQGHYYQCVRSSEQRRRNEKLRALYGITLEERDAMFTAQGSKCAICGGTEPGAKDWHTDHDHNAGHVRGILCNNCNLLLGHAEDNPVRLLAAMDYLRTTSQGVN